MPELLKSLGKHYSFLSDDFCLFWEKIGGYEREEPLPDKIINSLVSNHNANEAHQMQALTYAPGNEDAARNVDTTSQWNNVKAESTRLSGNDQFRPMLRKAEFAHIYQERCGVLLLPLVSQAWCSLTSRYKSNVRLERKCILGFCFQVNLRQTLRSTFYLSVESYSQCK